MVCVRGVIWFGFKFWWFWRETNIRIYPSPPIYHLYIKPDVTLPCGLLKSFPRLAVTSFLDRFFQSINSNLINYPRSCAETKWPWLTFRLKIYSVFCICLQRSVFSCLPNSKTNHFTNAVKLFWKRGPWRSLRYWFVRRGPDFNSFLIKPIMM